MKTTDDESQSQMSAPVIFIIFNRPDLTRRVFERISLARPSVLLIVADGPRAGRTEEIEKCSEVRKIVSQVNWPCEVYTNFSEFNLGCKRRVSTGISWAFGIVDRAIILEDDCLPDPSFFRYCGEVLERYKEDHQVMMVSGTNLYPEIYANEASYSFTRWPKIWGWATWKRAWQYHDPDLKDWPTYKESGKLSESFKSPLDRKFWSRTFQKTFEGKIDTWDHQWNFAMLSREGLSVQPSNNLITNLGFGADATHTFLANEFAELPTRPLSFPLVHPTSVVRSVDADRKAHLLENGLLNRIFRKSRSLFCRMSTLVAAGSVRKGI